MSFVLSISTKIKGHFKPEQNQRIFVVPELLNRIALTSRLPMAKDHRLKRVKPLEWGNCNEDDGGEMQTCGSSI
jgi:hypothetical protein